MALKLISLYSGCGGMDYGFEAAGFETVAALEFDKDCCRTLRSNRPWPVIEEDILQVPTAGILAVANLKPREADLLIGGPPCQPFSKAGYWATGDSLRLKDPRAATLEAYMRVVDEALPKAFVLENVGGMIFSGKSEGLVLLEKMIADINRRRGTKYTPKYKVLKAVEFGVPQIRERFFLVAHREGQLFKFPDSTHRLAEPESPLFPADSLEPAMTAWDALGDLPDDPPDLENLSVKGKWAPLLASIPEGNNYLHHTERGDGIPLFGWRRRYWTFLLKLAKNRPSWTLQAQPGPAVGPFHWRNRRLNARELCRLQTFPDTVTLQGSLSSIQRQAGNAVPALLAEVVGRDIGQQWFEHVPATSKPVLLQSRRTAPPPPETLGKVPRSYYPLLCRETPHPGTGKGYRAAARGLPTKVS
ncbi:DNA cytosine methyltransferase [Verrucomicrobium sp. BvORR106]|uniref:DNA cytosine methyltransferase n=1 Tax=Verrucomicrobium sp. BvORR106 TaxID=1403819 RepID=UPI0009DE8139|nr:DNA cytosine methyltransferase [Verrucomicrobium sp. BvORR106]